MASGAACVSKIYLPIVAHTSARGAELSAGSLPSCFIGLRLLDGGGVIVNTASISGMGGYGMGPYNAAKAGVINLTRTAALENTKHNIRDNCVCPGGINTSAPQILGRANEAAFRERTPFDTLHWM